MNKLKIGKIDMVEEYIQDKLIIILLIIKAVYKHVLIVKLSQTEYYIYKIIAIIFYYLFINKF